MRPATKTGRSNWLGWLLVAAVMALVAAARMRLVGMPLERDEGEFAYMGQLLLQGVPPYKLAYSMKFPGIYVAYALIMSVFGQTTVGIHLGLLLVNLITILLIFLLGKRLFGRLAGVVACACYALLSIGPSAQALAGHATHFVTLFGVAGLLVLLKATESGRPGQFLWSGILLGLATTMKQPGVFFTAFAVAYVLWQARASGASWSQTMKNAGVLAADALVPVALVFLWAAATGVLRVFWFWAFDYGLHYAARVVPGNRLATFIALAPRNFGATWPIWVLAGFGLVALAANRAMRTQAVFVLGLAAASAAAVSVGFYFRPHYMILAFPAASLLAGYFVSSGFGLAPLIRGGSRLRFVAVIVALVAIAYAVGLQYDLIATIPPKGLVVRVYLGSPFVEAVEIGNYLRRNASKGDLVAIVGSEPEICFYSGLRSATGYIYTYPLMEDQPYAARMHREMIREIESAEPKYLVVVNVTNSWCSSSSSLTTLADWMPGYAIRYYELVGYISMDGPGRTSYYWDENVPTNPDPSIPSITILRRR